MIKDRDDIAKLHEQFMAGWLHDGRTVDEAFTEIRAEAGAGWTSNNLYNRIPDKEGKDGFWSEVDGSKFLIWKMTHR